MTVGRTAWRGSSGNICRPASMLAVASLVGAGTGLALCDEKSAYASMSTTKLIDMFHHHCEKEQKRLHSLGEVTSILEGLDVQEPAQNAQLIMAELQDVPGFVSPLCLLGHLVVQAEGFLPENKKIEFIFDLCDLNGDGDITRSELQKLIITLFNVKRHQGEFISYINPDNEQIFDGIPENYQDILRANTLVVGIFKRADPKKLGEIDFKRFKNWAISNNNDSRQLRALFDMPQHGRDRLVRRATHIQGRDAITRRTTRKSTRKLTRKSKEEK